jgi:hypothetical protein
LADRKERSKKKNALLIYVASGAGMGAVEGIMVGALAGAMFDAFHIAG